MNRSTPGLPVHHHLPEFTQTHVYRVRDAIRPSHPGSSPSPPVPNLSQHQSLFSNESTLHMRCPKYWSFSFGIIPSKEIPGLERSLAEGNSNPLQCSFLGNLMYRAAWWAAVHGVTKSQTQLSTHTRLSDNYTFLVPYYTDPISPF